MIGETKLFNYLFISSVIITGLCINDVCPYPPQGRLMEFQGEGGFQMPIFLKESMAVKWNFQRGWGVQAKKPCIQGVWIYSGTTHCEDLPNDNIPRQAGKTIRKLAHVGGITPIWNVYKGKS